MVYPGGETSCAYGTPAFGFQVWPGDPKKWLIAFRGGQPLAYVAGAADAYFNREFFYNRGVWNLGILEPENEHGVFDRTEPRNVFRNWTVVYIPHCTGDVLVGNITRSYLDGLLEVNFNGGANVEAVLDWVDSNVKGMKLDALTIGGFSSGSLGVSVWAPHIANRFDAVDVTVFGDSSPSILYGDCAGALLYSHIVNEVGGCDLLPSSELTAKCYAKEPFDSREVVAASASNLPEGALWLEVGVKNDIDIQFQLSQVGIAALELDGVAPECENFTFFWESPDAFYADASDYYAINTVEVPNYLVYIINGTHHTSLNYRSLFTTVEDDLAPVFNPFANASAPALVTKTFDEVIPAVTYIANAAGYEPDAIFDPALADWLYTAVVDRQGASQCAGQAVVGTPPSLDYCDAIITSKSYDNGLVTFA